MKIILERKRSHLSRFLFALAVMGLAVNYGLGQVHATISASQNAKVSVSVWDNNYKFVTGLHSDDFELYEGRKKHPITSFQFTDEPADVGIIINISRGMNYVGTYDGSMRTRFNWLLPVATAIKRVAEIGANRNEFFIVGAGEEPKTLLEQTGVRYDIESALEQLRSMERDRSAMLGPAIALGVAKLQKEKSKRKVLILISDERPVDRNSETFDTIRQTMRASEISFNAVILPGLYNTIARRQVEELVSESGGLNLKIDSPATLVQAAEFIASGLGRGYSLGFVPDERKGNSKWRKIDVRVNTGSGSEKLIVRAPNGFFF